MWPRSFSKKGGWRRKNIMAGPDSEGNGETWASQEWRSVLMKRFDELVVKVETVPFFVVLIQR